MLKIPISSEGSWHTTGTYQEEKTIDVDLHMFPLIEITCQIVADESINGEKGEENNNRAFYFKSMSSGWCDTTTELQ